MEEAALQKLEDLWDIVLCENRLRALMDEISPFSFEKHSVPECFVLSSMIFGHYTLYFPDKVNDTQKHQIRSHSKQSLKLLVPYVREFDTTFLQSAKLYVALSFRAANMKNAREKSSPDGGTVFIIIVWQAKVPPLLTCADETRM